MKKSGQMVRVAFGKEVLCTSKIGTLVLDLKLPQLLTGIIGSKILSNGRIFDNFTQP